MTQKRSTMLRDWVQWIIWSNPFAYERFRQALDVFCRRRESVQRDSFSQEALDHTLFQAAVPTQPVTPPKGLQSQTLSRIEAYLRAAPDTRHTSG